MENTLLNWDDNERSPYRIPNLVFHEGKRTWKILSAAEKASFEPLAIDKSSQVICPPNYKLYVVAQLKDIGSLDLLGGYYEEVYEDGSSYKNWVDELEDYFIVDSTRPMYVFATYPFKKAVEIEIMPYSFTRIREGQADYLVKDKFVLGYLLWQISKAYEDIYKYHWKEVGVWGHEFMDLSFYSINFHPKNKVSIKLES